MLSRLSELAYRTTTISEHGILTYEDSAQLLTDLLEMDLLENYNNTLQTAGEVSLAYQDTDNRSKFSDLFCIDTNAAQKSGESNPKTLTQQMFDKQFAELDSFLPQDSSASSSYSNIPDKSTFYLPSPSQPSSVRSHSPRRQANWTEHCHTASTAFEQLILSNISNIEPYSPTEKTSLITHSTPLRSSSSASVIQMNKVALPKTAVSSVSSLSSFSNQTNTQARQQVLHPPQAPPLHLPQSPPISSPPIKSNPLSSASSFARDKFSTSKDPTLEYNGGRPVLNDSGPPQMKGQSRNFVHEDARDPQREKSVLFKPASSQSSIVTPDEEPEQRSDFMTGKQKYLNDLREKNSDGASSYGGGGAGLSNRTSADRSECLFSFIFLFCVFHPFIAKPFKHH